MIFCIALPFIVPKWVEGRVVMITGLIMLGSLTLLVGPVWEEYNLTVMLIGLGTSAIFYAPTIIPNMSEMMVATRLAYPDGDLDHVNSLLSGMLNACFGIGQAAGPLVGSAIYESLGFRDLCNITAGVTVAFGLLYFACAGGCQAFSQTCKNYSKKKSGRTLTQEELLVEEVSGIRHSSIFKGPIILPRHKRAFTSLNVMN